MEKIKFIYALKCPIFNAIRYIGQSTNPIERYKNHKKQNKNLYISNWINKLKEFGKEPELIILEKVSLEEANTKEDEYIEKYIKIDYLFNKVLNKNLKFNKKTQNSNNKNKKIKNEILELRRNTIPFLNLTKGETIIIKLLVKGTPYKRICDKLDIKRSTLKTHLDHIRIKLKLGNGTNNKDWIFDLIKLYNKFSTDGLVTK